MKPYINIFQKKLRFIFRVFLFILSASFVILLLPKESQFQFEFQKGTPWMHDNLIAKNDFPIYKPEKDFRKEKDSVISNFKPYFSYDSKIGTKLIDLFIDDYKLKKEQYFLSNTQYPNVSTIKIKSILDKYELFIIKHLENLYAKGIIEITDKYSCKSGIIILKSKITDEKSINEVYTLKQAYQFLNEITTEQKNKLNQNISLPEINFNNYLSVNLIFNSDISDKLLQKNLNEISPLHGMIQSGEMIIFKGELIDDAKYNILLSLKKEFNSSSNYYSNANLTILGQIILVFSIFAIVFWYIMFFNNDLMEETRKIIFILFTPVLFVFGYAIFYRLEKFDIYLIPLTLIPITIAILYNNRLALLIHVATSYLVAFFVPNSFEFIFMQFISGFGAVFSTSRLQNRSHIISISLIVFASYSVVYTGMALIQEGNFVGIDYYKYLWFGISSFLLLLGYPLIYFFEKVFGFISDVSLMEISDTNRPILRMIAEKAPGTFQHSVQVANLAEEAVRQIGGNPLLARAGALYHDIGKTEAPGYFTENQITGQNPHKDLQPEESVKIILNHITRGAQLAQKLKLPKEIIDFILTHQGTGKVRWFLHNYKQLHPEVKIDEKLFSYPGPKPFSKETAVMMMADSVEAASRSLKEVSDSSISKLVEDIIAYQISEKQFDNAPITFAEIETIKKVFKLKLKNIYHSRIEYPKEEKETVIKEN